MQDFRKNDFNQNIYNRDGKGHPVNPAPKVQSNKSKIQFRTLLLLLVVLIVAVIWIGTNLFSAKQTLQQHAQKLGQPIQTASTTENDPTQSIAADLNQPTSTTVNDDKATHPVLSHITSPKAKAETASGTVVSSSVHATTKPVIKSTQPTKPHKPVFDFYQVLPKQHTTVSNTQHSSVEPKQYMLQVASYQDRQAAEQMRAQLLLLGVNPKINQTGNSGNIWYRLDIGPFDSMQAADTVRQKLQKNGINGSMVRQVIKEQGGFNE